MRRVSESKCPDVMGPSPDNMPSNQSSAHPLTPRGKGSHSVVLKTLRDAETQLGDNYELACIHPGRASFKNKA